MIAGWNDLAPKVSKFSRVTRTEKLGLAKSGFGAGRVHSMLKIFFLNFSELC